MHGLPFLASAPLFAASPALAGALVASVWQGLLLTGAVALSLRLLPRLSSAARSAIWLAVLSLVVLLPVLALLLRSRGVTSPAALHLQRAFSAALVVGWAAASLGRLLQLAANAYRLRRILREAVPVPCGPQVATLLAEGPRAAALCISAEVDRPSVAGFFRPRILLPPDLPARLDEADLCQIVLHEREHLRRADDWMNLLQQISLVLFPLNPALVWLNRQISQERELACDDGVLRITRARKGYAACLARVAENSLVQRGASLALGVLGDRFAGWRRRPELTRRVERILQHPAPAMGRIQATFASGALLLAAAGSAALLAHSPQLVSFVPAAPALYAGSAPAPAAEELGPHQIEGRPILVKAVMPSTQATSRQAALTSARPCNHRRLVHRRMRPALSPWVVLTTWQAPAAPTAERPTAVRLTPVVFDGSQLWYTAVPWRDGWLVVQL